MAFKTYQEIIDAINDCHSSAERPSEIQSCMHSLYRVFDHHSYDLLTENVCISIAEEVRDVFYRNSACNFPSIKKIYTGKRRRKPHRHVTVVEFSDGTQIKVTQHKGEKHDPEKAVLFAIAKKLYGVGEGGFHSVMKNALKLMEANQ